MVWDVNESATLVFPEASQVSKVHSMMSEKDGNGHISSLDFLPPINSYTFEEYIFFDLVYCLRV